jgi:hypothetical protein
LSGDGFVTSGDLVPYVNYLNAHPGGGPIGSAGAPPRCDVNGDDLCNQADYDLLSAKLNAGTVQDLKSVTSCSDPRHMPLAQNSTPYPDQIPTNILGDIQSFSSQPPAWSETLVNTVDSSRQSNHLRTTALAAQHVDTNTAPGIEANTPVWSLDRLTTVYASKRTLARSSAHLLRCGGGQSTTDTGLRAGDCSTNPLTVRRPVRASTSRLTGSCTTSRNCVIDNFLGLRRVNPDRSSAIRPAPTRLLDQHLAPRWSRS